MGRSIEDDVLVLVVVFMVLLEFSFVSFYVLIRIGFLGILFRFVVFGSMVDGIISGFKWGIILF